MLDVTHDHAGAQGVRGEKRRRADFRDRAPGVQESSVVAGAKGSGGSRARLSETALLRHRRRRAGWNRSGGKVEAPGSPYDRRRAEQPPRRFLAKALQITLFARSRVVRPP